MRRLRYALVICAALCAFAATFTLTIQQQAEACIGGPPPPKETRQVSANSSTLRMELETVLPARARAASRLGAVSFSGKAAEAGTAIGFGSDSNYPGWENNDGRNYYYQASVWVDWTGSVPCTGYDTYHAVMEITCFRVFGGDTVETPCWFAGEYLALWVNTGNPYGYHKYTRSSTVECNGVNGGHDVSDFDYVWAKMITRPGFRDPWTNEVIHIATRSAMSSYKVSHGQIVGTTTITGNLTDSPEPSSYTAGPNAC